jgi:integrase/recombinase XerD
MNRTQHIAPSLYAAGGARKYVNLSERAALLSHLALLSQPERLFILVLIWTGARISEILSSVTPESFQLQTSVVAVRTLKRRRHVVREIPIPPELMAELNDCFDLQRRQQDPFLATEPLWRFHRVTGWRLVKSVMERAGIHGVRATPRGLRHGFGVGTLAAGVPLNMVQRLLGHSSIKTTTIYTEASGPDEQAIVSRFWNHAAGAAHGFESTPKESASIHMLGGSMFDTWLKKRRARAELVRADAASLMVRFGDDAYEEARKRMRQANEGTILDGNRPPGHWSLVRQRIADEIGHEIGLDTATRYLMDT